MWLDTNGGNEGIWTNYTNATTINIRTRIPTRDGYNFVEWNTEEDGSGTSYQPGDLVEIDPSGKGGVVYKLYAQWERKLANTLEYDANGGEGGPVNNFSNATTITVRGTEPTREGYIFDGWNTEADGSGTTYYGGDVITIDPENVGGQKLILYAQWAKAYTVTYTDPSGNFEDQVYNVKEGDNVPAFEGTPTRDGWAFSTWNSKYINGDQTKETVTADRTFSARWTKLLAELTEEDAVDHGAVRVTDILRPSGAFDLMAANAPHLVEGTFVLNGTTYDTENHKQVASVTITNPEAYAKFLQEVYDQYYDDGCKYIFDEANTPVENLTIHFARKGTYAGSSQYGNLQLKFGAWTLDTDYYPGGTVRSQLLFRRSYSVSVATAVMARANDYSLTLVEVSAGVFELVVEGEPTKEGYKLVGWNTEEDGSGATYQEGDHFNIAPGEGIDLHLYPMWELDLDGTITISPEDLTAYTGGESINANSFPNMRYRFTLDGDLDVSDGITLYETEDDVDNEEVLTEVEVNDSASTLSKTVRFFTRAKSTTITDPTLVPELQPVFTYDLEQSNSEYEGEVNPSDDDQYAGVYNVSVSNGDDLIAKIDGKFYDVEVEDANVLIRYVSDPEAILDDGGLDNFTAEVLGSAPSEEVEEITPVIDPDTTYYTNGNKSMAVMNKDAVRLLVDELLPPEQSDGVDRRDEMVQKADEYMEGLGKDTANMNYDFKYFDLINTVDGNAWVSSSEGTDIYFPYPEGTDMDTEFTVLHFKDLHREYGLSTNDEITDAINNCEIENMSVENTEYGIKIHVEESGFSPFALSWEEKTEEPDEPSPVDPGKDPSQDDDLAGIKDQLEDLIDKVEGLDKDDYTNESYKDLMDALDKAKDTLADPNADKEALTNAYDSLMEAYRDLKSNDITIPDTSSNSSYIISGGLILLSASLAIYYKKRLSR